MSSGPRMGAGAQEPSRRATSARSRPPRRRHRRRRRATQGGAPGLRAAAGRGGAGRAAPCRWAPVRSAAAGVLGSAFVETASATEGAIADHGGAPATSVPEAGEAGAIIVFALAASGILRVASPTTTTTEEVSGVAPRGLSSVGGASPSLAGALIACASGRAAVSAIVFASRFASARSNEPESGPSRTGPSPARSAQSASAARRRPPRWAARRGASRASPGRARVERSWQVGRDLRHGGRRVARVH